jgi:hypothetical protein
MDAAGGKVYHQPATDFAFGPLLTDRSRVRSITQNDGAGKDDHQRPLRRSAEVLITTDARRRTASSRRRSKYPEDFNGVTAGRVMEPNAPHAARVA